MATREKLALSFLSLAVAMLCIPTSAAAQAEDLSVLGGWVQWSNAGNTLQHRLNLLGKEMLERRSIAIRRLLESIGPRDAEQNLNGGLLHGIDHGDYLSVRAMRIILEEENSGCVEPYEREALSEASVLADIKWATGKRFKP